MKKLVAKRKHKTNCEFCNATIEKGHVYYVKRNVFTEDGKIYAYEYKECAKCNYKREQQAERFKRFKEICNHPQEFVETVWTYIPGECMKQPDHDECRLCNQIVWR